MAGAVGGKFLCLRTTAPSASSRSTSARGTCGWAEVGRAFEEIIQNAHVKMLLNSVKFSSIELNQVELSQNLIASSDLSDLKGFLGRRTFQLHEPAQGSAEELHELREGLRSEVNRSQDVDER